MSVLKHPFKFVRTKSVIVPDLINIAYSDDPWVAYYNFQAKPVSMEILNKDPFFMWLSQHYKFIAGILKMEPYQQYDWHVDTRRGVGINMLLEHTDSIVMFTDNPKALVKNVYPMQYHPETYCIFNTQQPHCVINLQGYRYLLSIEFKQDKTELSFDMLKEKINNEYYT